MAPIEVGGLTLLTKTKTFIPASETHGKTEALQALQDQQEVPIALVALTSLLNFLSTMS